MSRCARCREPLPEGVKSWCADCRKAYAQAWSRAHPGYFARHQAARRRARGAPTMAERVGAAAARRQRSCRTCGSVIVERWRRYCSDPCVPSAKKKGLLATSRTITCARAGCDEVFVTRRAIQRFCTAGCRRLALPRHDAPGRGAGRKFPRIRYRARRVILERSGWTCLICGAPIDRELRFPHPGSATIDHRDPDGAHDPGNWQAAHLGCNVSKGRKVRAGADPKLRSVAIGSPGGRGASLDLDPSALHPAATAAAGQSGSNRAARG